MTKKDNSSKDISSDLNKEDKTRIALQRLREVKAINAPSEPKVRDEAAEKEELLYTDAGNIDYDDELKKQQHEQNTDVHNLRKEILPKLYKFSIAWVGFVSLVLILSRNNYWNLFDVTDAILIALMTTMTTTILGLFGIAAAWLFPKK